MKKFIPKEKLSKSAKKSFDQKARKTWGSLNPVTRKPPNPKAYKRKKVQKGVFNDLHFEPYFYFIIFLITVS